MDPRFVAVVSETLSERGPDAAALEQIRGVLGATELSVSLEPLGPPPHPESGSTHWAVPLVWQRTHLGWLVGEGGDPQARELVAPLIAGAVVHQRERERSEARHQAIEQRAARALDLAELVTWLLHARDRDEVVQLGTSAIATLLRVEAGALCVRDDAGGWQLRVPTRSHLEPSLRVADSRLRRLIDRDIVESEILFADVPDDPVVRALGPLGFSYAFCVPLDSGSEPQGVVLALSSTPVGLDPEARVAAAQLSVMISVALDRLADQDRIAQHRKSLADALRAASMGTWELDLATQRVTLSRELNQLLGGGFHENTRSTSELVSLLVDLDTDQPARHYKSLLETGKTEPVLSRVRALDGRILWLRHLLELVVDQVGKPLEVRGVARDVTQEVLTQRELKASKDQLQQASAMAHIGAWDFDVATRVATWSEEVRRIYGVGPDYPPMNALAEFYAPDQLALLQKHHLQCLKFGVPYDVEVEVRRSDGTRVWVRHLGNAEQVDGRTVRLFGAVQDVTEQHRAREEALTASRVKSQFLANTSHEIRTPLNGIIGMTELALQTPLNAEQREFLEAVQSSGHNLLSIVNDILDISKIESGHLSLEQIPFSLADRVHESVRGQATRAHSRGLELVVDIEPSVPELMLGDPVRVGQIVTNLVGNAVKFTERGEVTVRVDYVPPPTSSPQGALNPGALHVAVSDTGIGIPKERIGSIFDAFTQADGSTNRRFGGTGLGLTITLELVKAMGGRIEVESEPGKGSTFHAWLALGAAPQQDPSDRRRFALRVLLVAGHALGEGAVRRQLEALGCEVAVSRPEEAAQRLLEALEGHRFDLLVTDQELPGTSGLELSDALHFHDELARIPRVLLVRSNNRPGSQQLEAAGIARVLTRPVVPRELAGVLSELTPGAGFRPQPSSASAPRPKRALHVLLAEDNAINARLARGLLEKLGHRVTHVTDGSLAVEAAARGSWDAVLMDMQMPVLDGLEATRQIRAAEQQTSRHLPIIALTANAMKGDDEVCIAAGMDAYLTKPIDLAALTRMLESLTARA